MESHVYHKSPIIPSVTRTTGYASPLFASLQTATDRDREALRAAKERFERQARWNRQSMALGLLLGPAALVAAFFSTQPLVRWLLLAAATLELGFVPCCTAAACRRLRRMIALTALDLKSGCVSDGVGQVRALFGVWRAIQDVRTCRVRLTAAGCVELADLPIGAIVTYRFALRSGVVLGVECSGDGGRAFFCVVKSAQRR